MFRRRTVFVLGAGASYELGFPLGITLRDEIRNFVQLETGFGDLSGECRDLLFHIINERGCPEGQWTEAARKIEDGLQYFDSIDDFLDHRRDDPCIVALGKMAIAHAIARREEDSILMQVGGRSHRLCNSGLENTWIFKLVKMLVKGVPRSDVDAVFKNVSFVTFNYDRSLQRFLTMALMEACDIEDQKSVSLVAKVPIHHVYGSLGALPGFGVRPSSHFGRSTTPKDIEFLSAGIRTYTERIADKPEAEAIKDTMQSAEKIVFLGCGFHQQNIDILRPPEGLADGCIVVATTHALTATSTQTVRQRLASLLRDEPHPAVPTRGLSQNFRLHDQTCTEFFDEYALALTD